MDVVASGPEIHGDRVERVLVGGGRVAVAPMASGCPRQSGAELRARPPRPIAKSEGVNGDGLAVQDNRAFVASRLVEVAFAQVVRRSYRGEREIDGDFVRAVGIVIGDVIAALRLETLVVDAVGKRDVRQRLIRYGQMPEVLRIAAVPRFVAHLVPEVRATRGHALVGAEERIQLPGEATFGDRE